jgi:hypothetical protein
MVRLLVLSIAAAAAALAQGSHELAVQISPYRSVAESTARWLTWKANCTKDGCDWPMNTTEPCCGHEMSLYYGPPGIALFYAQLANATGLPQHIDMAKGAGVRVVHTLSRALRTFGNNTALYYGSAGIAFSLRTLGDFFGDADADGRNFMRHAHVVEDSIAALALPRGNGTTWNGNTDVAHGAAGTGLYLLHASATEPNTTRAAALSRSARSAGDWLLSMAVPTPGVQGGGLKWPRGPDSDGSHEGEFFPNFCCGTAGIAYFLATLHRRTGEPRFLDAALRGARYLLSIARRGDDGILIYHDEPTDEHLYYLGWCHGPAGTSRLWARLYQATGDQAWWSLVLEGAKAIGTDALPTFTWLLAEPPAPPPSVAWQSLGQCCGGASGLNYLSQVERFARKHGLPTAAGRPVMSLAHALADTLTFAKSETPCAGSPESLNLTCWPSPEEHGDPTELTTQAGWMQGAAGVAASLLHFDAVAANRSGAPSGSRVIWPDEPWFD